ncbi:Mor transcription activator family protein [Aminipila sp.]|uniref:Mor transcription activator family protein n=1 Tax=Aminipila sp. TaxID=2060095 RepID=UPI0028982C7E|nr:Mor transcription activator family protein [Aminipila sp.]
MERIKADHLNKETLNDVYREIAELVGMDNMIKLYKFYKGQQVSFPTRIYRKEFLREVIEKHYDGTNAKDISRELGYSERWIKELAKRIKKT